MVEYVSVVIVFVVSDEFVMVDHNRVQASHGRLVVRLEVSCCWGEYRSAAGAQKTHQCRQKPKQTRKDEFCRILRTAFTEQQETTFALVFA